MKKHFLVVLILVLLAPIIVVVAHPKRDKIADYLRAVRVSFLSSPRLANGTIDCAPIPGGPFFMGSDSDDKNEAPMREVWLDTFCMGRREVSNAEYGRCVEAGTCAESRVPSAPGAEGHPVTNVSWIDAHIYCRWQNARLPSEAEWEKVVRGHAGRTDPWKDDVQTCESLGYSNCMKSPSPTSELDVVPYQVYGMRGNVAEWVSDWYSAHYYAKAETTNPRGPLLGLYKVTRGGYWSSGPQDRASNRHRDFAGRFHSALGFRCATDG